LHFSQVDFLSDVSRHSHRLALQAAQKIEGAWDRSWALREIAVAMAKAVQIERAVEVAEMIDEPIERLQILADIMVAKQKAGKGEAGKE
jgi:serine protease Do